MPRYVVAFVATPAIPDLEVDAPYLDGLVDPVLLHSREHISPGVDAICLHNTGPGEERGEGLVLAGLDEVATFQITQES